MGPNFPLVYEPGLGRACEVRALAGPGQGLMGPWRTLSDNDLSPTGELHPWGSGGRSQVWTRARNTQQLCSQVVRVQMMATPPPAPR